MVNDHSNGASCYFKAGTVNPLTKATSTIKNAIAHNRRTTQAAHGARSNIDPSRSHFNYRLAGDESPNVIVQKVTAGMIEHKARTNAPHAIEVLISLPDNWEGDSQGVFVDSIPYLTGILGADNLLSADVHLDEPNPHMHVLFMPLEHCEKKGRLVWRSTINKRTRELYDGFFSEVGAKHGLEKPINLTAKMRSALALAVIDAMNRSGSGATKDAAWEAIKTAIKANPKPFAVLYGINLKAFTSSENHLGTLVMTDKPLGSFDAVETEEKTKLPSCVWSFESTALPIDLKTGEIKIDQTFFETDKNAAAKTLSVNQPARPIEVQQCYSKGKHNDDMVDTVRVRESEQPTEFYDLSIGEYIKPPLQPKLNNRAAVDAWVTVALNKRTNRLAK